MTKDIKDYLHLYMGSECHYDTGVVVCRVLDADMLAKINRGFAVATPILRPLSDMTEEEEAHMVSTQETVKLKGYPEITLKVDSGETVRWMLSKGFDLFGLIESGLAIDKTKLTTP